MGNTHGRRLGRKRGATDRSHASSAPAERQRHLSSAGEMASSRHLIDQPPKRKNRASSLPVANGTENEVAIRSLTAKEGLELLEVLSLKSNKSGGKTSITSREIEIIMYSILRLKENEESRNEDEEKVQIKRRFSSLPDIYGEEVQSYLMDEFINTQGNVLPSAKEDAGDVYVVEDPVVGELKTTTEIEPNCAEYFEDVDSWTFDIFAVEDRLGESTMVALGLTLFDRHNMFTADALGEDRSVANRYLTALQRGYLPNNYHNSLHAADVAQTLHHFLCRGGLQDLPTVSRDLVLGSLVAALMHDVGHPGVNNVFLVMTSHELALQYNDQSPLENFHSATGFRLMTLPKHDIFQNLPPARRSDIRGAIIAMILATDNAHHTKHLGRLKEALNKKTFDLTRKDHQILLFEIALHTADVSNPAKPWSLYRRWTAKISTEFYAQGDQERKRGLPVTPMLDRQRPIPIEKFQMGFIDAIVQPLFRAFSDVPGLCLDDCTSQLDFNVARWRLLVQQRHSFVGRLQHSNGEENEDEKKSGVVMVSAGPNDASAAGVAVGGGAKEEEVVTAPGSEESEGS